MKAIEFVVIRSMGMSYRVRQQVSERRVADKCIACGEHPPVKREICARCYGRFTMHRPPKSKRVARAKYDAAVEAAGKIGPNRQGERRDLDEYRRIAASVEDR